MSLGITVGKFYPFHRGHDYLITTAKAQVDHLVVLLGYHPNQTIGATARASWLRAMHPDVEIILAIEDIPEAPEPWAARALELLRGRQPDVVFTSETYGEPWAAHLGARHIVVDLDRTRFPVSGTMLRSDLAAHWDMLTPPAKGYFARRVCIVGVESSGTTTLAQSLARHFQTAWVPEYGRFYWEGRQYTRGQEQWDRYEFEQIVAGQIRLEEDLATRANKVLICDTDPLATHVWHRRYKGAYDATLERLARSRTYDLYVLTAPDFDFVQDGTREGEHIRMEMHRWFLEVLDEQEKPFMVAAGSHEQRMADVTRAIEPLLSFPPLNHP